MKSRAWAAGVASCCLLSTLSLAQAGEVKLSEAALDRVTAGALLFEVDSQAFGAVSNQLTPGTLLGPPVPPPAPPPAPAPIPQPSNQVSVSDGGASATIFLPTSNSSGSLEVLLGATSGDGFAAAEAGLAGSLTGGANSRFSGGGTRTNVSSFFD